MLATASSDKTKFEQVPPIRSILAPSMASEYLGIQWYIMYMMPPQSALNKGSIHR